ncbi:rab11 family-interacting protein 1 isoform X1 [Lutra lutra]|uniref:rab11 family-interacting protein 1 isoform X1 n=2 Tax=Lutra lutra TaxID=9657 RepID=UPI001FD4C1C8|nr:rab11 family-interacting protein 1 isoform X1 [Lutra lutra]
MSLAASAGRGSGSVWSPTHVQVTVLQARGLRAKGPGGTSDAYAVIQVGKEKYATSVSERSLGAPVWREEATFELPPLLSAGAAPAAAATLQLTVLHRALLGLDKFLGRAEVDLRELHRDQGRRKTQWYTLKSKPGKKDKERGAIEVDIQFMRNNMTASMFDLSMKDKSRNPFGKLKDKIKGKHKDSASDTASAIIPSVTPSADSDDESPSKDKKKKSKIKTLFSKSNLQKTPLSQSMSVLPTSKSDRVLLRPGDFQSGWEDEDNEDDSPSASDVMSHKRTGSADAKQLNQINFSLPKKEGLSFLGGLRSKNDVLSRSNVCINGNHVYMEQPEAKSETKDSTPSSSPSPQGFRKKHLFSSTENLAPRSWKEPGDGGAVSSEPWFSESSTKDSLKTMSLPSYRPQGSGDIRESAAPVSLEATKETKESKKQENKKSSLLSLVTGKKDVAKGSEGGSPPTVLGKEKEGAPLPEVRPRDDRPGPDEGLRKRTEKDTLAVVSGRGKSLNPFEEVQVTEPEADREPKSEAAPPVGSARAPQTKAVKPRLDVSPEAQPTARLSSSPDSPVFFSALLSSSGQTPVPSKLGHGAETPSSESPSVFSFSSPIVAPISTSTPVENWPSTDKGQASPEEPSLPLKAELPRESLIQVPKTVSGVLGSLSRKLPTPACKGTEDSPTRKTSEIGPDSTVGNDSEKSLVKQSEMGHHEEILGFPASERDSVPSSQEAQEVTFGLSLQSDQIESPAGKHPMRASTDSESPSVSFGETSLQEDSMTSAMTEAVPPFQMGESAPPLGSVMRRHEENVGESRKKIRKHVSFSEQLFTQEEVEQAARSVEEDRSHPRELTHERAAAGNASDGESAEAGEREAVSPAAQCGVPASVAGPLPSPSCEEKGSEAPMSEAGSGKDIPLLRIEPEDTLMAPNQSKANDHEGLLSEPLSGLHSTPGVNSPVVADLGLTLPSIPEVASDDERVDQVEDNGETAQVAAPEGGPSSLSLSPVHPEMEKGPRGEADGWAAPAEGPHDPGSKAPKTSAAASPEPTAASGIHKPDLGKSSWSDEQLPCPGGGEREKLMGNGRPSPPPDPALDSPVASPSFSENFPVTRSFSSYPHADTHHTSTAESQKKATAEGPAGKVESSGKRKPLLQAWVSPSETLPISAQPSVGTGSAKHRLHPVKPMNTTATKIASSSLGTATIISENLTNETAMKKYNPSDPAFAYAQLTHDELIQLVLKQKEMISKKEFQVRELEDYIDNLLVRVMEETPNILRVPAQVGKKAGKM